MSDGGRGSATRRAWLTGIAVAVLVVPTVFWALAGREEDALGLGDRTDLVAMAAGVAAVVLAVAVWPRSESGEAAAVARLAREVKAAGEPQWMSSLGGDLRAIDVTFTFRRYASARAARLPASPEGRLEKVVEDFRRLRPRRLVITGEPGAGKTVLARKFVMELNRVRAEDEPVPVLVSLADWDTREPLRDWLTRRLRRDYGLSAKSAGQVVAARMVLPVLDGLDEMDEEGEEGVTRADSRAGRALEVLARHQDGTEPAPFVLTCRTRAYDAQETGGGHVLDAARIAIDPVTADRARDFLAARGAARRPALWQPLLDELRDRPGGVLARTLSTPWRLTLAAVAYDWDGDPGELLRAGTEAEAGDLLLSRFIAASSANTLVGAGRYAPERIHRGLRTLAELLGEGSAARTDLVLLDLGNRVPRWAVRVPLVGAVCSVWLWLVLSLWQAELGMALRSVAMCAGVLMAGGAGVGVLLSSGAEAPRFLAVPRLGSRQWWLSLRQAVRRLTRSFRGFAMLTVVLVSVWQLGTGELGGEEIALLVGVTTLGLALVLGYATLEEVDRATAGPVAELRGQFLMLLLLAGAVPAFVYLLPSGGSLSPEDLTLVPALVLLSMVFMARLLAYGLFRLRNVHRLPLRLVRFLDWSVAAGLMRTSGAVYQFRHREFQEWLVRHPAP
ncbi:NACHT domain-containing protein [Streptomyces sp. NPDC048623]|uniref:NACHT domain-containing protein n=1 Tax=Streptomyces sp. NPDC048623 TaxID=3155761 RepID=UPI003440AF9D